MVDEINIIGRGPGLELAPKEDCWGINSVIFERPVDVHFDMHEAGKMNDVQIERRKKVIERANELNIPVYAVHSIDNTTYERYPIERVMREFRTGYFSNGVCYMIALAVMNGVKKLNFYGVNHSRINFVDEYTLQKPGVDFWLGVCTGRGVEYTINGVMSEIGRTFDNHAYGYQYTQEDMIKRYGIRT